MAGHTKGPWVWKQSDHGTYESLVVSGTNHDYVLYPEMELGDYGLSSKEWCEVSEANARLIAAAPELLEALKEAREAVRYLNMNYAGFDYPPASDWDLVIAKATQP